MATEFDLKVRKEGTTPNFDKWKEGLKKKNPDIDTNDMEALYAASMKGYDEEHDYAKSERDYIGKLRDVIEGNPRVGEFLDELVNKGLGGALASLSDLQQALMKGEITDEEYNRAVKEKSDADAEKEKKEAEQEAALKAVCDELKLDYEDTCEKLVTSFFGKLSNYDLRENDWKVLINMLNYDENIKNAEIKGRNEQIELKRGEMAKQSDGLIKGNSTPLEENQKEKSMADYALDYRKKRRF